MVFFAEILVLSFLENKNRMAQWHRVKRLVSCCLNTQTAYYVFASHSDLYSLSFKNESVSNRRINSFFTINLRGTLVTSEFPCGFRPPRTERFQNEPIRYDVLVRLPRPMKRLKGQRRVLYRLYGVPYHGASRQNNPGVQFRSEMKSPGPYAY